MRKELLLFSHSVMSDSFQSHGLKYTRLPCPSPSSEVCSNSLPLCRWCHATNSSSIIPFSSCLQSCPASGSFLMIWLFASGGQSIGASASASVLPMSIQCRFPFPDWFDLLAVQGTLNSLLQNHSSCARFGSTYTKPQFKSINSSVLSFLYSPTLTSLHDYWKNHSFD